MLLTKEKFEEFSRDIENLIVELSGLVRKSREKGEKIAGWGAGQRGCTLINTSGKNCE